MTVTIRELARHLGLAVSTVSKALNDYDDISMSTKQRVREAALELGYHPSHAARMLRRKQTDKIGLIFFSPYVTLPYGSEFLFEMMRGAVLAAENKDYHLVLYFTGSNRPNRIVRICQSREVDGLILMSGGDDPEEALEIIAKQPMPFVVLHHRIKQPGVSFIVPDNLGGAYLATQHLLELGHRRVGYLGRLPDELENTERFTGYRKALREAGIPVDEALVAHSSLEEQAIRRAVTGLLDQPDSPTAVFAFNDGRAIVAQQVCARRGLRIPEDVAIVGFDDIPSSRIVTPRLTTVRQPLVEMGRLATEMLLAILKDGDRSPIHQVVPVELIIRESTVGADLAQAYQQLHLESRAADSREPSILD